MDPVLVSPSDPRPVVMLLSNAAKGLAGIERNMLQLIEHLGGSYRFAVAAVDIHDDLRAAAEAFPHPPTFFTYRRPSKGDLRGLRQVAALIRHSGADLVHTQDPRTRLIGQPAARLAGVRHAHTFHMSPLFYAGGAHGLYRAVEWVYGRLFNSGLLFVSSHVRDHYARLGLLGRGPVVTIPNGIDPDDFAVLREERDRHAAALRAVLGVENDTVVFVAVGRLMPQKGFDLLIDALPRLSEHTTTPFHVALVGDGVDREALRAQAAANGADVHLSFLGWRSQPEVHAILAGSDGLVLPSRYECFPYALLEGMAAAVPCVATDVGGNGELVEDGKTGFLVPSQDITALALALARLADDPALRHRFGAAGLERVGRFSVERMVEATDRFYQAVLRGNSEVA